MRGRDEADLAGMRIAALEADPHKVEIAVHAAAAEDAVVVHLRVGRGDEAGLADLVGRIGHNEIKPERGRVAQTGQLGLLPRVARECELQRIVAEQAEPTDRARRDGLAELQEALVEGEEMDHDVEPAELERKRVNVDAPDLLGDALAEQGEEGIGGGGFVEGSESDEVFAQKGACAHAGIKHAGGCMRGWTHIPHVMHDRLRRVELAVVLLVFLRFDLEEAGRVKLGQDHVDKLEGAELDLCIDESLSNVDGGPQTAHDFAIMPGKQGGAVAKDGVVVGMETGEVVLEGAVRVHIVEDGVEKDETGGHAARQQAEQLHRVSVECTDSRGRFLSLEPLQK